jgi:hypothetical protein
MNCAAGAPRKHHNRAQAKEMLRKPPRTDWRRTISAGRAAPYRILAEVPHGSIETDGAARKFVGKAALFRSRNGRAAALGPFNHQLIGFYMPFNMDDAFSNGQRAVFDRIGGQFMNGHP